MKNTIKTSLIVATCISALQANNQYTLESVSVTSSQGTTLKKKDVTDSTTIITKEAIEESRITTLNEALNKLGGLAMTQSGGTGQTSSIFLRGMSSKRLLVLIDGIRYNDPTSPGAVAEFSHILLDNIERIEIIKGAQSGVWGSDASGGVINIITKKAHKGLNARGGIEYGSFDTKKFTLDASYATEVFDIALAGSLLQADGFSAVEPKKSEPNYGERYDTLNLEKDKYTNRSVSAKLGFNVTQNDRFELDLQDIDAKSDFDSGAGSTNDSPVPHQKLRNTFYKLSFQHKDAYNDINIHYSLSKFDRNFALLNWSGVGVDTYDYKGSVSEVKLDDTISYLENSFLRFGASYQKFEQKELTNSSDKSYSSKSVFLTNYNKFSVFPSRNTIITESLRYDDFDAFENAFTGKLGLKQFVHNDLYISANVGTGYNAPTLGQLYGAFGPNPNLKPEKSLTTDITIGNDTVWLTGFYNEISDLIDWTGIWPNAGYNQIDGKSKFQGIELGYEDYFFDTLGLNALYTYVETEDAQGKELARRPKNQIDAQLTYYASENLNIGLNGQYVGQRYDGADKTGAQTGEYVVANLVANLKMNKSISVYAKADNLTDKYYQTVDGYATAGRSFYFGLIAQY